jgi:hypothetical protein
MLDLILELEIRELLKLRFVTKFKINLVSITRASKKNIKRSSRITSLLSMMYPTILRDSRLNF